jgi:hypothetical protein
MRKPTVLVAAACLAVLATPSHAANTATMQIHAHGNVCMPATNDLTRTSTGIRNNTTGNRAVYCGFEVREGGATNYSALGVELRNHGSVDRTVTCYWTIGTNYSGYSSVTVTAVVLADGGAPHIYYANNVSRSDTNATLGLRCTLPPGILLEGVEVWADPPA